MAAKNPFRTTLIAPCGMNCAICTAFLREKNRCEGCYSPDRKCFRNCTIFSCDLVRGRYRHPCDEYPCRRLRLLDKRYRTRYHMSMIGNLEAIREHGISYFVRTERERWTCTACGGTIDLRPVGWSGRTGTRILVLQVPASEGSRVWLFGLIRISWFLLPHRIPP
jgi:hypothetical protein